MSRPFPMRDTVQELLRPYRFNGIARQTGGLSSPDSDPAQPHTGLVTDPVISQARAQETHFADQLKLGRDLEKSGIGPQNAAEQMALDLAKQYQPVIQDQMVDPLNPVPNPGVGPQPFNNPLPVPHPYDPTKPPGGM